MYSKREFIAHNMTWMGWNRRPCCVYPNSTIISKRTSKHWIQRVRNSLFIPHTTHSLIHFTPPTFLILFFETKKRTVNTVNEEKRSESWVFVEHHKMFTESSKMVWNGMDRVFWWDKIELLTPPSSIQHTKYHHEKSVGKKRTSRFCFSAAISPFSWFYTSQKKKKKYEKKKEKKPPTTSWDEMDEKKTFSAMEQRNLLCALKHTIYIYLYKTWRVKAREVSGR